MSEIFRDDESDFDRRILTPVPTCTHDRLEIEAGSDAAVLQQLTARGHEIKDTQWTAKVQMIQIQRDNGTVRLRAASDYRKGGAPAGE